MPKGLHYSIYFVALQQKKIHVDAADTQTNMQPANRKLTFKVKHTILKQGTNSES